jgi:hypothetical protein
VEGPAPVSGQEPRVGLTAAPGLADRARIAMGDQRIMSDFDTVLERLMVDPAFRAALGADPGRTLAGYRLSSDEIELLHAQVETGSGGNREVEQRTSKASLFGLLSPLVGAVGLGGDDAGASDLGRGVRLSAAGAGGAFGPAGHGIGEAVGGAAEGLGGAAEGLGGAAEGLGGAAEGLGGAAEGLGGAAEIGFGDAGQVGFGEAGQVGFADAGTGGFGETTEVGFGSGGAGIGQGVGLGPGAGTGAGTVYVSAAGFGSGAGEAGLGGAGNAGAELGDLSGQIGRPIDQPGDGGGGMLGHHLHGVQPTGQGGFGAAPPPPDYHPHIDVNGDGRWDQYTVQRRSDGGVDLIADMDRDGRADFVGHDYDRDGLVDAADYDKDRDGRFETHMRDVNGDGWLDTRSVDPPPQQQQDGATGVGRHRAPDDEGLGRAR